PLRRPQLRSRRVCPLQEGAWPIYGTSNGEGGALPFSRTRCLNGAAVHLDHITDDGQTEAQSAILACRCAVRLPESIEDIRQELRINSHAGIGDGNLDLILGPAQLCLDTPSLVCELYCIPK